MTVESPWDDFTLAVLMGHALAKYDPRIGGATLSWEKDGVQLHMNPSDKNTLCVVFEGDFLLSPIDLAEYRRKQALSGGIGGPCVGKSFHFPTCDDPANYKTIGEWLHVNLQFAMKAIPVGWWIEAELN